MLQVVAVAVGLGLVLAQPAALAQQASAPPAPAPPYRLALTAGLDVGDPGWGTVFGGIAAVAARVELLPWLGVGLSYLQLSATNNEGYPPFTFQAFEVFAAWRPVVGRWFDPFVQAGALGVVGSGGGYEGAETTSRFGLEGMVGFDFVVNRPTVRLPLAVGVHARSGFTSQTWTLAGLHIELRV
jgi:hypothetical protein